jgi:very-short-patch-repair endonuclease
VAYVAPKTLSRARKLRRTLTDAETILWSRLRRNALGMKFRRQHPVGPYIADFACTPARLIVEVDGGTHSTDEERDYDARRDAFLRRLGRRVARVSNADVYKSLDGIMEMISEVAHARACDGDRSQRS